MHFNFPSNNSNDPTTMLSQSLFAVGKHIQRECIKAKRNHEYFPNDKSRDGLIKAMGKLEGFLKVSRTLCNKVNIGADTKESDAILEGCAGILKSQ
jgi:hypothetical protein